MKQIKEVGAIRGILAACATAVVLAGCGGGGGGATGSTDAPYKPTDAQLAAATNPGGTVATKGSGLVVSPLAPAPPVGGTASDGTWFNVDSSGSVSVSLTTQDLAVVSRVSVISISGSVAMSVDASNLNSTATLQPGRYKLQFTAASSATQVQLAALWFGTDVVISDVDRAATGNCPSCNLKGANLSALSLRGANMPNTDFRDAILFMVPGGLAVKSGALLTVLIDGADAQGVDLTGANLAGARFDRAQLNGTGNSAALFAGANLGGASLADVFLAGADMRGANLGNADLSRSVLTRVSLRGADLSAARFDDADLSGADLTAANVQAATFLRANLVGATWTDGRICAANSRGSCL